MRQLGLYVLLFAGLVVFAYPFVWMAIATFTPEAEIPELTLWPLRWTLAHYRLVFDRIPIDRALLNSVMVAVAVTTSALVLNSMAAYALAKLHWRGRETVFTLILFTLMVPFLLLLIPLYTLVVRLGWTDSLLGLIVPFMANATGVLILRQSFLTIPQDLLDAARIDGCGELRILFTIVWPLSVPALVTVGLLTFMGSWNEVLWPILVVRELKWMTMPQMVALFAVGGGAEGQLGPQLAAAFLLALPIVVAYLFFQRYFIQSFATGGLKG